MKIAVAFISMLGVVALGTFAWTGGYSGFDHRFHGSDDTGRTVTLKGVIHKVPNSNDYVLHLATGEEIFLGNAREWQNKGIKVTDGDQVKLEVAVSPNETCIIRSMMRCKTATSDGSSASIWAGYECND